MNMGISHFCVIFGSTQQATRQRGNEHKHEQDYQQRSFIKKQEAFNKYCCIKGSLQLVTDLQEHQSYIQAVLLRRNNHQ